MVDAFEAQSGRFLLWSPITLGLGIWAWFSMRSEPGPAEYLSVGGATVAILVAAVMVRGLARTLLVLVAVGFGGFLISGHRAHHVATPVLDWRYYGPVEGRVVMIDRSASDKVRLTLDQVRLDADRVPRRVRVALWAQEGARMPRVGERVGLTAHLSPPPEAPEPYGFDFQRHAWFLSLGAVGYTRSPAIAIAAPSGGLALLTGRARAATARWVERHLPTEVSGVATALMTGDRSGIPPDVLEDLRQTNLAHLLAISGMHMGLLTGLIYASLRIGLILLPGLGLRWPVRKIAAASALLAGAGYLALSGASVATERAFIMVAVVLGAVLLGRRPLTLRAVAVAAFIVLLLRPEALLSAGFHMSFAATIALILAFQAVSPWMSVRRGHHGAQAVRWLASLLIASTVAGLATAPFAAAHFNLWSSYGLIANTLAVPMMGAVVAPGAILAALLAP
ncbi:MAG: ComEC/Rec2 family competence protein, partial [Shimia sp.]